MKFLLALTAIAFLTACSPVEKVVVQNEILEQNIPTIKRPRGLDLIDVNFIVANELTKIEEDFFCVECDGAIVVMSVRDYSSLGLNMSEITRWIEQSNANFDYYEGQLNE